MQHLPDSPNIARITDFDLILQAASAFGTFHGAMARSNGIAAMEGGCPCEHDRRDKSAGSSVTALRALLAATFLALCPIVQAQSVSQASAYGLSGRIGLGVASVPTYEGRPNDRMLGDADDLQTSHETCHRKARKERFHGRVLATCGAAGKWLKTHHWTHRVRLVEVRLADRAAVNHQQSPLYCHPHIKKCRWSLDESFRSPTKLV